MTDLHDTEMTGTISTARHQVVRYRAGHEIGDLFEEGQEFDGLTLTIEVADAADAQAMLDAISSREAADDDLRAENERLRAIMATIASRCDTAKQQCREGALVSAFNLACGILGQIGSDRAALSKGGDA